VSKIESKASEWTLTAFLRVSGVLVSGRTLNEAQGGIEGEKKARARRA